MKKIFLIIFMILFTFSFAGCGKEKTNANLTPTNEIETSKKETGEQAQEMTPSKQEIKREITIEPSETMTPTEEESEGIEVDEGLLNVTITIPASMFEDMTDFDPDAHSKEHGFKETVVNEDGSVSITMSRSKHNELMKELKSDIDESLEELIEAENTPYIKKIITSDGYRIFTVDVDKAAYEATWDFTPLQIGIYAMMYQQFDGSELHCEIIIRDVDTGEILKTVIYPDVLNN